MTRARKTGPNRRDDDLATLLAAARPRKGACPDATDLVRAADGLASTDAALQDHLTACRRCACEVESLARASLATAGRLPGPPRAVARAVSTAKAAVRGRIAAAAEAVRGLFTLEMPLSYALALRSASAAASPHARYEKAMKDYRAGRIAAARKGLEAALDAGEDAPEVRYFLGSCLLAEGRAADALEHLTWATAARPKDANARWQLAQALLASGRGEEAARELEKVAKLPGPHRARARKLLSLVRGVLAR